MLGIAGLRVKKANTRGTAEMCHERYSKMSRINSSSL
jgi:hypothetical protein